MWSQARCFVVGSLLVVAACGGAMGNPGWESGSERDPSELPYPAAPPAPPLLAASDWKGAVAAPAGALVVHTEPGDIPRLELATDSAQRLPLEHTHVKAKLTGFVAEVEVTQTYKNPHAKPIEAIYVFPLPENSAVNHMRMVIDKRVIEAKIDERNRARRTYEQAKRAGHTAALLEQERPNVFTQSVANIEPGKKIDVAVRYVQDLTYDAGQYEFVFPMVVGPRYFPGAPLEELHSGSGTHAGTTSVPDASRVSPPIVGKGERSGHDISIELVADTGLAVGAFETPTHEVIERRPADGTLALTLAEKKSLPNRDFVLRYRAAGEQPKAVLYTTAAKDAGGFFSLVLEPPNLDVDRVVGQRELTFVVDISGSMSGVPLEMCKTAMRDALGRMRPVDTFNILTFAGATKQAFERARPANSRNLREGLAVVDAMSAGGGTEMLDAVAAALRPTVEHGRDRYVFFMTDGYVGNEEQILSASEQFVASIEKAGRRARVFGYGVGSSVNRYLIEGLSRAGKGLSVFAGPREDPRRAVNQYFHYIDRAVLTDLRIDWGTLRADQVMPATMPDLFASHPVILHGRYRGSNDGPVTVTGKAADRPFQMKVAHRRAELVEGRSPVLGLLWARSKVASLEERLWDGGDAAAQQEITRLGLDFGLVTRFTSFVAVDTSRRVGDGSPERVVQPVEAPEGVDVAMAGGVEHSVRGNFTGGGEDKDGVSDESDDTEALEQAPPVMAGAAPAEPTREEVYEVESQRGCGCRAASSDRSGAWSLALLGVAVLVARRRRAGVRCLV
jgi:Ca-activated chloride channel homolog